MQILLAGATGAVGSSLSRALALQEVRVIPLTSRLGSGTPRGVLDLPAALEALGSGGIDAVVNAAGPGDHRAEQREVEPFSRDLTHGSSRAGVPAVLISTLRVCEGATAALGDDQPTSPTTTYATANADHEEVWMEGDTAVVLRLANYFCLPRGPESPQRKLLPWSLLVEGWETGHIAVRSEASVTREFVSADDAARAIVAVIGERPFGRRLATLPGLSLSLRDLVDASIGALASSGVPCTASFGQETQPLRPVSTGGWLASRGWESRLSLAEMQRSMRSWLIEWGQHLPTKCRPKES